MFPFMAYRRIWRIFTYCYNIIKRIILSEFIIYFISKISIISYVLICIIYCTFIISSESIINADTLCLTSFESR